MTADASPLCTTRIWQTNRAVYVMLDNMKEIHICWHHLYSGASCSKFGFGFYYEAAVLITHGGNDLERLSIFSGE